MNVALIISGTFRRDRTAFIITNSATRHSAHQTDLWNRDRQGKRMISQE